MTQEIWTRIPGYIDYRISIFGRIKRIKNGRTWKAGHIKKPQFQGNYYNIILYKKRAISNFTFID